MLLKNEYIPMKRLVNTLAIDDQKLLEYSKRIEKSGKHKNLYARIANDIKYCIKPGIICKLYDKYDCNDDHVTTLFKAITKELYPITYNYIKDK